MSLDENIVSEIIKDGIKIITYKDGSQHIESIEKTKTNIKVDNRSWWQKLKDWWNNTSITPYIKIRDLADSFGDRDDQDKGSDGKSAAEIGIRIKL